MSLRVKSRPLRGLLVRAASPIGEEKQSQGLEIASLLYRYVRVGQVFIRT